MLKLFTAMLIVPQLVPAASESAGQAVHHFAMAGDRQDVAALASVLHDDFRVSFVVEGADEASQLTRAQYLDMVKSKKLGGDTRRVELLKLDVQGNLAFARVRLTGQKASFECMQTLLKRAGEWKMLSDTVLFTPKG